MRSEKQQLKEVFINLGVTEYQFLRKKKHPCIEWKAGGRVYRITYSNSPGDHRGVLNNIARLRKMLHDSGAVDESRIKLEEKLEQEATAPLPKSTAPPPPPKPRILPDLSQIANKEETMTETIDQPITINVSIIRSGHTGRALSFAMQKEFITEGKRYDIGPMGKNGVTIFPSPEGIRASFPGSENSKKGFLRFGTRRVPFELGRVGSRGTATFIVQGQSMVFAKLPQEIMAGGSGDVGISGRPLPARKEAISVGLVGLSPKLASADEYSDLKTALGLVNEALRKTGASVYIDIEGRVRASISIDL